jgi:hypothetical protein
MPSMISRARASAIVFSAWASVSAVAAWYLAWISGCLRRNAALRRVKANPIRAWPVPGLR